MVTAHNNVPVTVIDAKALVNHIYVTIGSRYSK